MSSYTPAFPKYTRQKKIKPPPYKLTRKLAIERDNGLCICGRIATETHHIMLRSHSGNNSVENLISLCGACHIAIHKNEKAGYHKLFAIQKERYPHLTKSMLKRK